MDSDQVQCPFCLKHVKVRSDGKLAKHTVTTRLQRGGKACAASETTIEEARAAKAAGRFPLADVEPEDVF